jgi:hypothetical protein
MSQTCHFRTHASQQIARHSITLSARASAAYSGNPALRSPSISSFAFDCPPRAIHADIVKAGSSSSRRVAASRASASRPRWAYADARQRYADTIHLIADIEPRGRHVRLVPIGLQKSQNAVRLNFRQRTKQAVIVDRCRFNRATEVRHRMSGPPHQYSIAAPTARKICGRRDKSVR